MVLLDVENGRNLYTVFCAKFDAGRVLCSSRDLKRDTTRTTMRMMTKTMRKMTRMMRTTRRTMKTRMAWRTTRTTTRPAIFRIFFGVAKVLSCSPYI